MYNDVYDGAVLYCRVSTLNQVKHGSGIDTQELIGRAFCETIKIPVVAVFKDKAQSGGIKDRPDIIKLLAYLKLNPKKLVVMEDLLRNARDVEIFKQLEREIYACDCAIRYTTMPTLSDDLKDPISTLIKTVIVATGQFTKDTGGISARKKQIELLKEGKFKLHQVWGYQYINRKLTPIKKIKELWSDCVFGLLSGSFKNFRDCSDFLVKEGITKKPEQLKKYAQNPIYAGMIHKPHLDPALNWIKMKNSDGTIDEEVEFYPFEIYLKLQEHLGLSKTYNKPKTDHFTFRGLIKCGECGKSIYGTEVKNRHGQVYEKYCCKTGSKVKDSKCKNYWCSISQDEMEKEVLILLQQCAISETDKEIFRVFLEIKIREYVDQNNGRFDDLKNKVANLEGQKTKTIKRLFDCDIPELVEEGTRRIKELNEREKELKAELAMNEFVRLEYSDVLDKTLAMLEGLRTLVELYGKVDTKQKREIIKVFLGELIWTKKEGLRTLLKPFVLKDKLTVEIENKLSGGTGGVRTRDLCRDRAAL